MGFIICDGTMKEEYLKVILATCAFVMYTMIRLEFKVEYVLKSLESMETEWKTKN